MIKPVDPLVTTFPPGSPGEPIVDGKGSVTDPVASKPAP
jgi:hypothetical protein